MGSTGKETFRIEWQVLHSKVRSSKPRSPGEIRANPILCLQVGHDGRSVMELLITTRHSEANDRYGQNRSVRLRILSDKILAQLLRDREPGLKIGIGSAGHGWMRDRHGLGPEAPYPRRAGSCLFGFSKLVVKQMPDGAPKVQAEPGCAGHFRKWTDTARGARSSATHAHSYAASLR
jgi:hypothetical protein